jgi:DNA-directed RNA polymerase subunit RPC12/RpoP
LAILEKEVWVSIKGNTASYFEKLGYDVLRVNGRIPHRSKILVKVEDLPDYCSVKLTKICDSPECGEYISNQTYCNILMSRKKGDGKDRCVKCGSFQKWNTRKRNIKYEQSLEYYAKENNMRYLIDEFSDKNNMRPHNVFKASSDLFLWNCSVCKSEYSMSLHTRTSNGTNCPYCGGRRVNHTNSLWTTHPEIAKLLKNPQRGYEINAGTNKKEIFVCKDCGFEQSKLVTNVVNRGLSCSRCGDGLKYPEKFSMSVLEQLNVEYETQKIFKWSNKKKYDFYIEDRSMIIETHGIQHYEEIYASIDSKARTLEEEQMNDDFKTKIAEKNNIEKYIVIDCRESNIEYIKNSFINSELSKIYNLDFVNWMEAHFYAINSNLVKIVCDIWENKGIHNTVEIGKIVGISRSTVCNYLKRGKSLGWCNYDSKEALKKTVRINGKKVGLKGKKKVVQLTKDNQYIKAWESAIDASRELGISRGNISNVCKGKSKTSAGFKWMFKEDYDKLIKIN